MDKGMSRTERALAVMTLKQRRRWRLRLKGRTISAIARIEGVDHSTISRSLAAGKKKAKKIVKF